MTARTTFEQLACEPDEAIDIALGAALIARDVYDELDVDALLLQLERLAGPLSGGALAGMPLLKQAEAVSERFRELGFRGNAGDYYDVRNSLLPDVIERRTGIPITLTLIWCEIARRAGVLACGVGFPGHFLARIDELPAPRSNAKSPPVIVDPFNDARIVTDVDARRLLQRTHGPNAELLPELFEPATSRATLVRMLTNLKAIWAGRGDHMRAFVAIDRILSLRPDSAEMLRERGTIAVRLGLLDLARRDFERALELEPGVAEHGLRKQLAALTRSPKAAPN